METQWDRVGVHNACTSAHKLSAHLHRSHNRAYMTMSQDFEQQCIARGLLQKLWGLANWPAFDAIFLHPHLPFAGSGDGSVSRDVTGTDVRSKVWRMTLRQKPQLLYPSHSTRLPPLLFIVTSVPCGACLQHERPWECPVRSRGAAPQIPSYDAQCKLGKERDGNTTAALLFA